MTGRVVLLSGASRGIGQAVARRLAALGYVVAGTATSPAGVQLVEQELSPMGGGGVSLNVRDGSAVDKCLEEVCTRFGAPAILVNNAGISEDQLLIRMREESWDRVLDVNLNGSFRLSKACLRSMLREKWGRIVNVGSVVASMGNAGQAAYAAAKAGLEGFVRALSREVAHRGVTVNCVAPGFIDTDMTRALSEAQREALMATIPVARMGKGEEVAAAVAFLVSEDASYVTGETLHVNGGMYAS